VDGWLGGVGDILCFFFVEQHLTWFFYFFVDYDDAAASRGAWATCGTKLIACLPGEYLSLLLYEPLNHLNHQTTWAPLSSSKAPPTPKCT